MYGYAARRPITGITLIAGFASTVGWPVTAYLDAIAISLTGEVRGNFNHAVDALKIAPRFEF